MPKDLWVTTQLLLVCLDLTIIQSGFFPNPWPTVIVPPADLLKVTILNPAVVLAWTVDAVLPSLLVDVVPPLAFHCQATNVAELVFTSAALPMVKPS